MDEAADGGRPVVENGREVGPAAAGEERFRLLVDSVRDYAIFLLDPEGNVLSWNAGAQRIKGYRAEEIIGRHFSTFYDEEAKRRGHPAFELQQALKDGAYEEEGWRLRKDGQRFWASVVITTLRDAAGRHVGFAKVTRDLTERREAEERLRESEERLRLLVESVRDYAIFMLDTDGRIVTWNAGAARIKGYRAEEVIGRHFSIFYPAESVDSARPAKELAVAREQGSYEEEGWRVRKSGERFWASVVLTAVYDHGGVLRGYAKVTRDLTERRRMEEEARESERRAAFERARALEAERAVHLRDEFISIAAHELRTPLTALQLKLQTLRNPAAQPAVGAPEEARFNTRLAGALRQVERLNELVERLLDVSRIVAGRLEVQRAELDLSALVEQLVGDLREPALRQGSTIHLELPERPLIGNWDRARLEQVIVNLTTNAVKYGGGKPVEVRVDSTKTHGRISVTDHGIGISPEDVQRIFARFERAVPVANYGGLGLGLYITRHIVEAHGGTIEVESAPDQGSTFRVLLPFEPED